MSDQRMVWILGILSSTPQRWIDLASHTPGELFALQPAPGEWSALECLQHLIDVEKLFHARLGWLMAGQDFAAFDPDTESTSVEGKTAAGLAAEFANLRQKGLTMLGGITPADYARTAKHQKLGPVTLWNLINEWPGHDLAHTRQAEQALMQPFINDCGPWQIYFDGHFVAQTGK